MAQLGRYYKGDPYRGQLYAPPVQFIAAALEGAQKQYDTNFAAAEDLKNKYIQALPQDRARANQLQQGFETEIDSIVNKYGGDYSQATKDLYKLRSKIGKTFGPGGEAGTIAQNYSLVQDSLKRERERLAKGEIDQIQFQALTDHYNNFAGTQLDPNTGTYSQVPVEDLAKYVAPSALVDKALEKVKPKTIERSYKTGRKVDGQWEYATMKQQAIDPLEAAAAVKQAIMGDQGMISMASQMSILTGGNGDPTQYLNDISNYHIQNTLPVRTGVTEDSYKLDYKDDWRDKANFEFNKALTLEAIRHRNAKERMALKDSLDNPTGDGNSSFLTLTKAGNNAYAPLPLSEKVGSDGKPLDWRQTEWWTGGKEKPTDARELIRSNKPGVHKEMLQSIVDANPTAQNSDIIRMYNERLASEQPNSRISYNRYETSTAQKEDFDRLIPELLQGNRKLVKIDRAGGNIAEVTDQNERIALGQAWAQTGTKSINKKNFGAIGKTSSASGHVPIGTILPDPTGSGDYYVVAENRSDMINIQENYLDPLFKFQQDDLKIESPVVDFPITGGKRVPIIGRKQYHNGIEETIFYEATRTGDNTHIVHYDKPVTKNGRPATAKEIEEMMLPFSDLKKLFPHKTKGQAEGEFYQPE